MTSKENRMWQAFLTSVKKDDNAASAWFESTELVEIRDGIAIISTPDPFTREWLEKRLSEVIIKSLQEHIPEVTGVEIIIREDQKKGRKVGILDPSNLVEEKGSSSLNEKYTFETFVIGPSNHFAHAAARSVAESPTCYNPLFIYADPGLGKTHLLHSIGHYFKRLYPKSGYIYISSEKFVNDYITALINNRIPAFQKKYRSCDLLMVDDIQFLAGKERMQEEFFHTFNELHNNNRQVVITCDRPPKDIPTLETRLVSRFEWGLVTDIQPPDLETRIAILRKKAGLDKKVVPDDVVVFIASNFETNIRELEGALIRVLAFSSLSKIDIDMDVAKDVLKSMLPKNSKKDITMESIISTSSSYFEISPEQLISPNRSRNLVKARQISMYLCRELTDNSLPSISEAFGGRHHSTVIHAINQVKVQINERRDVYIIVQELTNLIKSP
jgi:chromosomal replication initiator protein